jgi:NMD protein affecting ribosome stability and mRNA decay
MDVYENLKWKEITTNKVRVFQLDEEPEVFYLIKIRDNEYMIVHEDGYDMNTGKVEFLNEEQVIGKYGIEI